MISCLPAPLDPHFCDKAVSLMPDDVCRSRQRLPRNCVDDEFPGLEVAQMYADR
jgi:hypothetical protein